MGHDGDNLSDHKTVFLDLKLNLQFVSIAHSAYSPRRPSWCKATSRDLDRYRVVLACKLADTVAPGVTILCCSVLCRDKTQLHCY
jgi:hypothetical protein